MGFVYNPLTRQMDYFQSLSPDLQRLGQPTVGDISIYINASTGNDITGNGTAARPYATIPYAYEQIPYDVEHTARILIASGTYQSFPALIENRFHGTGSLAFVGVGVPVEVLAEVTLTGKANLGLGGHSFTVSGSSWTPELYTGLFMEVTSGTSTGKAMPVLNNTADTLVCPRRDSGVPGIGDKVRIIRPSVVIECERITLNAQGEASWDSSWNTAPVKFLNLDLDMTAYAHATVTFKEGTYSLQLVSFKLNNGGYDPLEIQSASINRWTALDTGAGALTGTNITNLSGAIGHNPGFTIRRATPSAGANGALTIGYPRGSHGEVCEFVALDSVSGQGDGYWSHCGVRRTHVIHSHTFFLSSLYDVAGANDGAGGYTHGEQWLSKCYFLGAASSSIQVAPGCRTRISECEHDSSTPYGAVLGPNCTIVIDTDSATGLAGNTADIKYLATDPDTTDSWPGVVGTNTSDGIGSNIVCYNS